MSANVAIWQAKIIVQHQSKVTRLAFKSTTEMKLSCECQCVLKVNENEDFPSQYDDNPSIPIY